MKTLKILITLMLVPSLCFGAGSRDFVSANSDFIAVTNNPGYANADASVCAWIFMDAYGDSGDAFIHTIFTNDTATSIDGLELRIGRDGTDANKDKAHFHDVVPTNSRKNAEGGTVSLSTWTHICGVANGANATIFLDGSKTTGDASTGNIEDAVTSEIGRRGATRFWEGRVAYFSLHDVGISDSDVANIRWLPESIPTGSLAKYTLIEPDVDPTFPDIGGSGNSGTNSGTDPSDNGPPVGFGGFLPL